MVPAKHPENSPQGPGGGISITTHQVHRPSILGPPVAVESLVIKSQLTHSPKLLPEAGGGAALR